MGWCRANVNIEDLTFKFEDQTRPSAVQVLDEILSKVITLTNEACKQGAISLPYQCEQTMSLKIDGPVQIFPLKLVFDVGEQGNSITPVQPISLILLA